MKTQQRVRLGFTQLKDENLLVIAQTILAAMTDNESFIDPTPNLEDYGEAVENYMLRLSEARKIGGPFFTAAKNEARIILESNMIELGFYVNKIADGNLRTMLSSGFPVSKPPTAILSPETIQKVVVSDGRHKGEMVLSFEKLDQILFYEYRYSSEKKENGEVDWTHEPILTTSSRKNLIKPVTPGEIYYLSVRGVNAKGTGDWSEPVSWMAR